MYYKEILAPKQLNLFISEFKVSATPVEIKIESKIAEPYPNNLGEVSKNRK